MRTFRFLWRLVWVGLFLTLPAVPAVAQPATVIATGLQAPMKVRLTPVGNLLVLEGGTGPNTGRISILSRDGTRRTLVDGLPSGINLDGGQPAPIGPTGVEISSDTLYVTIGSGDEAIVTPGSVTANPNASSPILSSLLKLRLGSVDSSAGNFHLLPAQHATLKAGTEVTLTNAQGETLRISLIVDFPDVVAGNRSGSNPFGVVAFGNRLYVVDAAFDQIQSVDPTTGSYTTLVTFPRLTNPLAPVGPPMIDPVPDSIRVSNGQLLVTFLTGFPFPQGLSSVARVDPSTGSVQTVISGRTSAIDVVAPTIPSVAPVPPPKYLVLEFSTNMNSNAPGQLLYFDSATAAPTVVAAPLITPTSMAFDPQTREVFITEFGPGRLSRVSTASIFPAAPCTPDAFTLCLNGGRYQVRAAFRTPQGVTANAVAVAFTETSGYFWFFSPDNVEVTAKVLDGCSFNSRRWFFASGMTNVNVIMTVTDTMTGVTRSYENPSGTPFAPILDTAAFLCP
jgi:hypothetical protein